MALAGVSFRTGSVTSSGERVLSGLVCRVGEFNFVSDNAGCFANKPFPADGFLMMLGSFVTYVTTEPVREYPAQVLVAEDPPAFRVAHGRRSARPGCSVEVMMTGPSAAAGKGDAAKGAPEVLATPIEPAGKPTRTAKFPKERPDPVGPLGMSGAEAPLEEVLEKLARPVAPGANVELTVAELEAERLRLQKEARLVVESRQAFERDLREYNAANGITDGFTPVAPRKKVELRNRGKDLNDELARAARSSSSKATSHRSGTGKPVYSSPAKNLRAAAAA